MPSCCAGFCTSRTSFKGQGQTFHRFPFSQPHTLEKWVLNMNRDSWMPTKASVLCSDHFEDKCFDRTGQTVRLRVGAVPTRFKYPLHMLKQLKLQQPPITCALPEETFISNSVSNAVSDSRAAALTNNCTSAKPSNSSVCCIDHSYSVKENPITLKRDLSAALDKIDDLQRKLKTSRQKSRRLEKKVKTLQDVVQTLKDKQIASAACTEVSPQHTDIPEAEALCFHFFTGSELEESGLV